MAKHNTTTRKNKTKNPKNQKVFKEEKNQPITITNRTVGESSDKCLTWR